jgi:hypothetical protein
VNTPARMERRKLMLDTSDESNVCKVPYIEIDFIIPAIYDDMDNIDNNKISERYPKFGFGDLLDEILDDFGGVLDIFVCEWDDVKLEGEVVCLMKDWRVFRYFLKQNDIAALDREKRIMLINKDCLIFEDVDDWCAWKELDGDRAEKSKKEIEEKMEIEKQKQSAQDYVTDLEDFFNGSIEKMQKKMQQNKGV